MSYVNNSGYYFFACCFLGLLLVALFSFLLFTYFFNCCRFFLMYKPKSISIAGVLFKIHYKQMNDFGLCDIDKKLITIRDTLTAQETLETILHESLHACLAVSGLSYLLNNEDTEEALIRCIDSLYIPIVKNQLSRYNKKNITKN